MTDFSDALQYFLQRRHRDLGPGFNFFFKFQQVRKFYKIFIYIFQKTLLTTYDPIFSSFLACLVQFLNLMPTKIGPEFWFRILVPGPGFYSPSRSDSAKRDNGNYFRTFTVKCKNENSYRKLETAGARTKNAEETEFVNIASLVTEILEKGIL